MKLCFDKPNTNGINLTPFVLGEAEGHVEGHPDLLDNLEHPAAVATHFDPSAKAVVIVDTTVAGYQTLLKDVDPAATVYLLDPSKDGVEQIADIVSQYDNLDALHIISHGEAGQLSLGTATLNETTLQGIYADDMGRIGQHLSANADILIYGCNFGEGVLGHVATARLAALTGADVADSTNATGSAALGGDWVLENSFGTIETQSIASSDWDGLLAYNNTNVGGNWAAVTAGKVYTNTTNGVKTTITFTGLPAGGATRGFTAFNTSGATEQGTLTGIVPNLYSTVPLTNAGGQSALGFIVGDTTNRGAVAGTVSIAFDKTIVNPIINIDRLGGTPAANNVSYSSKWTVTSPGVTMVQLTGGTHLVMNAAQTSFNRLEGVTLTSNLGEVFAGNGTQGTWGGSIQVLGTFGPGSTLDFSVTSVDFDGMEMSLAFDAPPTAVDDSFTGTQGATLTGNLFANNGAGLDSDPTNDALHVNKVNGVAAAANTPITLANGVLTITDLNTGAFTFKPNASFTGTQTFTYDIADPAGGVSNTATATINVQPDTDSDGIINSTDLDDDNDGILDTAEGFTNEQVTLTFQGVTNGVATFGGTDASGKPITMTIAAPGQGAPGIGNGLIDPVLTPATYVNSASISKDLLTPLSQNYFMGWRLHSGRVGLGIANNPGAR